MLRRVLLAGCLCAPALLAGCDSLAELVGVDAFDIDLGDAARFPLVPATTLVASTPVAINEDLPDVFDVERISIPPGGVSYTPTPDGEAVCDVRLTVVIDGAPALQSVVALDEAAAAPVTGVTSRYAEPYDRGAVCAGLDDCPVAAGTLSEQQIRDRVDGAVDRGAFDLDFIVANDGDCAGVLRIETLRFELDF